MSDDAWAVITGAGSGIGKACALLMAERGIGVVCAGRTRDTLDATVAAVVAAGSEGVAVVADCDRGRRRRARARGRRSFARGHHPCRWS